MTEIEGLLSALNMFEGDAAVKNRTEKIDCKDQERTASKPTHVFFSGGRVQDLWEDSLSQTNCTGTT